MSLICAAARADVVTIPAPSTDIGYTVVEYAPVAPALPVKGETMPVVTKLYGQPLRKHPPVGGHTRRQPRITRWDYAGFSVFFERGTVIDSVVQNRPAPVQNTDGLKPVN